MVKATNQIVLRANHYSCSVFLPELKNYWGLFYIMADTAHPDGLFYFYVEERREWISTGINVYPEWQVEVIAPKKHLDNKRFGYLADLIWRKCISVGDERNATYTVTRTDTKDL